MYLELSEALDCPECRSGVGLVAFVDEAEGRRVLRGRLGCPLCEVEFPVRGGVIRFGEPAAAPDSDGRDPESPTADHVLRLAALLGVDARRGIVVLLGPGLGRHGAEVARLAERAEVISWIDEGPDSAVGDGPPFGLADLEAGVDPVSGVSHASWPVRTGFLDGVALGPGARPHLDEAERCLKPGGRLVLLAAPDEVSGDLEGRGFAELARDAGTWVGERA